MPFFRYPLWSYDAVVIPDDTGGAFVISNVMYCLAHCVGNSTELRVQRVTPKGGLEAGWNDDGLSIGSDFDRTIPILIMRDPVSIPNGHGSAFITWNRRQSFERGFSPVELRIQRVDSDGAMPWGPGGNVIHSFASRLYYQAVVADGEGGVYVFWLDERTLGLYAQHIAEDGRLTWATDGIAIATSPSTFVGRPVAVTDGAHGALVAWAGSSGSRSGVFAVRVTPSGALPWRGDREVFEAGPLRVDGLRMVPTPKDGAILAWRASRAGADDQILAQQIDLEGKRRWGESAVSVCAAAGSRDHLAMTPDPRGGAYLAWVDSRPEFAVYAMHLEPTGKPGRGWTRDGSPVCARLPLSTSPTGFDEVSELEITAREAASARDHRGGNDEPGVPRGMGALEPADRSEGKHDEATPERGGLAARRDAGAIVAWVDNRYRYCYVCDGTGLSAFAMLLTPDGPAIAPVAVAPAPPLASPTQLSRASASPSAFSLQRRATAGPTVTLSLPDASQASLELFDLAGRKLWSREVGGLGAGVHEVRVGDGARYPSGIYIARLTQGSRIATTPVALVR